MSDNLPGNDGSTQEQILTLVGFWMESMIYGIYAMMFFAAIVVSLRNRRNGQAFSMVLFLSMISMFIMITIFTFINLYRGIQAYAMIAVPPTAVSYYHDVSRWDNFAFGVIVMLLTWHADALVIYRCFVIWGHNFWVIIVPCCLLVLSFVTGTMFLTWSKHTTAIPFSTALLILDMTYPVNVAQSTLTTGLIAYKIYSQHRKSVASGVFRSSTGMSLLTIVRIVIESALIFTLQQLVLLILLRLDSPAQVIFHATTIPSIGIVFVLMALRTHFAQTHSEVNRVGGSKFASHTSGTHRPGQGSIAVFTTKTVKDDIAMSDIDAKHSHTIDGASYEAGNRSDTYGAFDRSKAQPI